MNTQQKLITICLLGLPEKDQAVIQRVISFGASQGKPYALASEQANADITITLDNHNAAVTHGLHIRIGEPGLPCHLLIQRPLLVTRVMRTLDDAAQLLKSCSPLVAHEAPTSTINNKSSQHTETTDTIPPPLHHNPEATTTVAPQRVPEEASKTSLPGKIIEIPSPLSSTPNDPSLARNNCEHHDDDYRYTALVVDDSAAIRKQLELELRDARIRADFAETGEEALEKALQKQYDIVFLDIILPGIDGYEVCRQMRVRKNMKKTPIIMLSGKTSPLDEVKGVIAGASTYLTKPVKHEQFQQTLQRVSKWLTNFAC